MLPTRAQGGDGHWIHGRHAVISDHHETNLSRRYTMTEADFRTVVQLATSLDSELQRFAGFATQSAIDYLQSHPEVLAAVVHRAVED